MVSVGYRLKEKEYTETPLWIRILHNNRTLKTNNSIFDLDNNVNKDYFGFSNRIDEVKTQIEEEKEFLKSVIKEKTTKKSQINNLIVESIISISDDEESKNLTKEDYIKKVENHIQRLKDEFNIKVYSYRIHLDEGHIDIDGNQKINRHIHLIHSNVNMKTGKSYLREVYQKSKKGISYLQDIVSETFEMKRGIKNSKNKHIDYRLFKKQKEEENKFINKINNLTVENEELKTEKKALKNETEEFKNLHNQFKHLDNKSIEYKERKTQITKLKINNIQKKNLHKVNKETITFIRKLTKDKLKKDKLITHRENVLLEKKIKTIINLINEHIETGTGWIGTGRETGTNEKKNRDTRIDENEEYDIDKDINEGFELKQEQEQNNINNHSPY